MTVVLNLLLAVPIAAAVHYLIPRVYRRAVALVVTLVLGVLVLTPATDDAVFPVFLGILLGMMAGMVWPEPGEKLDPPMKVAAIVMSAWMAMNVVTNL